MAVVPADGVLEPAVGEEPVGEQAGLARQAEVQREQAAFGGDEVLLQVVVPVVAVRRQHPAELDLEPLARADVQVAVEQVPLPVDAPLERHLVLEQPGQAAFEVDPDPGDVQPAPRRALVVGDEVLEVGLVEHAEPEDVFLGLRFEGEPLLEAGAEADPLPLPSLLRLLGPRQRRAGRRRVALRRLSPGGRGFGLDSLEPFLQRVVFLLQLAIAFLRGFADPVRLLPGPGFAIGKLAVPLEESAVRLLELSESFLERGVASGRIRGRRPPVPSGSAPRTTVVSTNSVTAPARRRTFGLSKRSEILRPIISDHPGTHHRPSSRRRTSEDFPRDSPG